MFDLFDDIPKPDIDWLPEWLDAAAASDTLAVMELPELIGLHVFWNDVAPVAVLKHEASPADG
jgi:hypothetical protein